VGEPMRRVLDALPDARPYKDEYRARCPVHRGKSRNSLSVHESSDGLALIHCWGGCQTEEVVSALGLRMADLFPDTARHTATARAQPRPPSKPYHWPKRARWRQHVTQQHDDATYPSATAGTLYAAHYLADVLSGRPLSLYLDERMRPYIDICEDLLAIRATNGAAAARHAWHDWEPALDAQAPALSAMVRWSREEIL
jgi:hypothetical protein